MNNRKILPHEILKVETKEFKKWGYTDMDTGEFITHQNDNIPAIVFTICSPGGTIDVGYSFYKHGVKHRDGDLPQSTSFYPNGKTISIEKYIKNGKNHRDNNKPSYIEYSSNGDVIHECFEVNGVFHRDDGGPTDIDYDDYGGISFFSHRVHGVLHRDDNLPAISISNPLVDPFQKPDSSMTKIEINISYGKIKKIGHFLDSELLYKTNPQRHSCQIKNTK